MTPVEVFRAMHTATRAGHARANGACLAFLPANASAPAFSSLIVTLSALHQYDPASNQYLVVALNN